MNKSNRKAKENTLSLNLIELFYKYFITNVAINLPRLFVEPKLANTKNVPIRKNLSEFLLHKKFGRSKKMVGQDCHNVHKTNQMHFLLRIGQRRRKNINNQTNQRVFTR